MKRQKYSNGATVKKEFKNVGSIEGKFNANQSYQSADITGSVRLPKGMTANASIFKDSAGNKNTSFRVDKNLPKDSSIGIGKNSRSTSVFANKGNFSLEVRKPKKGDTYYGITYSKKI
jgi:hypothetical protein